MNRTRILSRYVDEVHRTPFAYGRNDCLLMVAGAVERITGIDHAAPYRGRYRTLIGAKRMLGKPPLEFVAGLFEEYEHQSRAGDGDIGAFEQDGDWCFGVFIGAHLYLQTVDGLGIRPRSDSMKAFRVP